MVEEPEPRELNTEQGGGNEVMGAVYNAKLPTKEMIDVYDAAPDALKVA